MTLPRLTDTDLTQSLTRLAYNRALASSQRDLQALVDTARVTGRPIVLAFEGWDASGKGGAIRRVTAPLDPRSYVVHPIGPPEGGDARRHYLYRFWRRLSEGGRLTVFDRSWYGRVLVERVEGFASGEEWQRAYREIRDFEQQLVDGGVLLFKFMMHLSPEEQLRRFKEREATPAKRWKLTDEDWRNREKWDAYYEATEDMLAKTHTPEAPWTVVAGDCKRHARVQVVETLVAGLGERLGPSSLVPS